MVVQCTLSQISYIRHSTNLSCLMLQRCSGRGRGPSYGSEGSVYSLQTAERDYRRHEVYTFWMYRETQILHSIWKKLLIPKNNYQCSEFCLCGAYFLPTPEVVQHKCLCLSRKRTKKENLTRSLQYN